MPRRIVSPPRLCRHPNDVVNHGAALPSKKRLWQSLGKTFEQVLGKLGLDLTDAEVRRAIEDVEAGW